MARDNERKTIQADQKITFNRGPGNPCVTSLDLNI